MFWGHDARMTDDVFENVNSTGMHATVGSSVFPYYYAPYPHYCTDMEVSKKVRKECHLE